MDLSSKRKVPKDILNGRAKTAANPDNGYGSRGIERLPLETKNTCWFDSGALPAGALARWRAEGTTLEMGQTNDVAQPVVGAVAAEINGEAWVDFNGSQILSSPTDGCQSGAVATWSAVIKLAPGNSGSVIDAGVWNLAVDAATGRLELNVGAAVVVSPASINDGLPHVAVWSTDGTNITLSVDGAAASTAGASAAAPTYFHVGSGLVGSVAQIASFSEALSADDVKNLNCYLGDRYSLPFRGTLGCH